VWVKVDVWVGVGVNVGVGGSGIIWMAETLALFTLAGPNWMTICPLEGWMLLNILSSALLAPTSAKMSRLVMTWFPLMETLKTLAPEAVKKVSANFKVTW
jgi:hypothetical protein